MVTDKSLLLDVLGDTTELRVIDFLLDNLFTSVYKNEIIQKTGLSRNSFFRVWKKLEQYKIVKPIKQVGKATLYQLNEENEFVKWLVRTDLTLIEQSVITLTERPIKASPSHA
ncbi:MAG: hypothetical protein HY361_02635 [Candidatus Aenigmarchaeota archaeon]|nr:hypothetical protein [Candidatus Aenigmarchaeota archaeon]